MGVQRKVKVYLINKTGQVVYNVWLFLTVVSSVMEFIRKDVFHYQTSEERWIEAQRKSPGLQ